MMKIPMPALLLAALIGGCATTGGTPAVPAGSDIYAYVADRPVRTAELQEALDALPPYQRQAIAAQPALREQFIDDYLTRCLVAQVARARGLDRSDTFVRRRATFEDDLLLELYMNDFIARVAPASDSDARAYYEAHRDDFTRPAAVRLQYVQVADSATADSVYAQARAGVAFSLLQARHSLSGESETTLPENNLPAGLRGPLAALAVDGILPPYPTAPGTIYVFRKLADIPAESIPYAEVSEAAHKAAWREKVTLLVTVHLAQLKREHPFRIVGEEPVGD